VLAYQIKERWEVGWKQQTSPAFDSVIP
jgi:hypothetical protein